jgi:predicted DCC family thiol-disulfide oxidoreductase YuxK
MGTVGAPCSNCEAYWIIVDDSCPVVHKLSWLVRQWDRHHIFRLIGRDSADVRKDELLEKLSQTPWSLMLLDQEGHVWLGPEAIPFILKNLPSGKIAAVAYTVPGTMWLTRKLYHMVSRNRRLLSAKKQASNYKAA